MIKAILKRNNILLSQFANDLNISRPTLDNYIKSYDSGTLINNVLFQEIFEYLFKDDLIPIEEFQTKYLYIVNKYGKKNNMFYNSQPQTLPSVSNPSQLASNYYTIPNEVTSNYSSDELEILSNLLKNEDKSLRILLMYNMLLNNKLYLDEVNKDDLSLIIQIYLLNKKIKDNDYSYSSLDYQNFKDLLSVSAGPSKEQIKDKLKNKVTDAFVDRLLESKSPSEVDKLLDSLLEAIVTKK